jgi:hypothetical protein
MTYERVEEGRRRRVSARAADGVSLRPARTHTGTAMRIYAYVLLARRICMALSSVSNIDPELFPHTL